MIPEQDTQLTEAQDRHVAATRQRHAFVCQVVDNFPDSTYIFFILLIVCFITFANFLYTRSSDEDALRCGDSHEKDDDIQCQCLWSEVEALRM